MKIGATLLGMPIVCRDLMSLGWKTTALLLAIGSTILVGVMLAKWLGLQKRFGALVGEAVGIRGASAATATAAVLLESRHKARNTLVTIIVINSLSTIAMVLYPVIADLLH